WVFRSLRDKLPEGDSDIGDVWAVVPDQDGTTFVSTTHILRWDGKRFVRWKKSAGGKLFPSLSNGRLFVHEVEKGLFEVDALGPRLVMSREILGDSAVVWVECRPEGWLLGRSAGFLRYDGKAVTPYAPAIDK